MIIRILMVAAVLTTLMIAAGSNQIFLKSSAVQDQRPANSTTMNIRPNIQTDFNPNVTWPKISKAAML
jgi:hypothetical protein